jgi:hypothetical protein
MMKLVPMKMDELNASRIPRACSSSTYVHGEAGDAYENSLFQVTRALVSNNSGDPETDAPKCC